jgi:hypothetical protein
MTTKKGTKVLTELLNIQGIKVTQMSQLPGIGIILQVESIQEKVIVIIAGQKVIDYIKIIDT